MSTRRGHPAVDPETGIAELQVALDDFEGRYSELLKVGTPWDMALRYIVNAPRPDTATVQEGNEAP